jgi:hypothetical protein
MMDDYGNCVETVAELKRRVVELEAAVNRAFSDRDYWLQWKKAVPVEALRLEDKCYLPNLPHDHIWHPVRAWLATLDAPAAKPSPVAAFAALREEYHQYFDYETDEAQP